MKDDFILVSDFVRETKHANTFVRNILSKSSARLGERANGAAHCFGWKKVWNKKSRRTVSPSAFEKFLDNRVLHPGKRTCLTSNQTKKVNALNEADRVALNRKYLSRKLVA